MKKLFKKNIDVKKTFIDILPKSVKTALVDEFGSYTYQDLDRLSNGVAVKLIGRGIGAGDIVPILMTRSKSFVAAFIGVMKSGAAFVPLDINYPEERIKTIEDSVDSKIVIDDEWMKTIFPSDDFINNSKPDGMAFIIFTSGSSGKPKGIVRSHYSALMLANSVSEGSHMLSGNRYANILGHHFMGGLTDYLTSLYVGATLFIASDLICKDYMELTQWLVNNKIEAFRCLPSVAKILVESRISDQYLKWIEVLGEKQVPINNISNICINNHYGNSECGSSTIYFDIKSNETAPIGRPFPFIATMIVDDEGFLCKSEKIGELCISGPQMASGYWKMPELTAEKFVHCPFLPGDVKMYKTGDLARYREDGNIELVGRKDFQIKIRGFRIEPGEIENVAIKFEGVDTVVVVAKEIGKEKQLILYYTSNSQVDERGLKEYLSKYLADYMVPNFYVRLDEMPRNANGKIDRNALPEPIIRGGGEKSDKPTELEKNILDAIANEIGHSDFGVFDSFESLGISSIGFLSICASLTKQRINTSFSQISNAKNIKAFVDSISSQE